MNLTEDTFIIGMWFMGDNRLDFMMTAFKNKGEDFIRAEGRMRYHVDDEIFESDDEKRWFELKQKPGIPEDEMILETHMIVKRIGGIYGLKPEYVPVGGGVDKLQEALKDKDWAHFKTVEPGSEEAKRLGLEDGKEAN